MTGIYPVEGNGFYLTFIDKEFKWILCNKGCQNIFVNGITYPYRLTKHNETDIEVYVVYTDGESPNPHYFTKKSLSEYFDTKSIFREEKLNILGI